MKWHFKLLGAVVAMAILTGQAQSEPSAAESLQFPAVDSAWLEGGTFVNVANLRQVAPGLNKDQLYDLLGRPHFKTGMFGVKEWNYLFNFRTGKGAEFVSCQYKVLFDDNYVAKSFHWKSPACESIVKVMGQN